MSTTETMTHPAQTTTTLNYHLEVARGGAAVWCPGTVQDKRRPHEHKEVAIENIRDRLAEFSVNVQGFEVGPFETSVKDCETNDEFTGQYYTDVCTHVKKVTGATKIFPVAHIVRRLQFNAVVEAEKDLADDAPVSAPTSNRSVHVDQSYFGAELVRDYKLSTMGLPADEVEKLKGVRWGIINLWRPLNDVTRDPLACCDSRTVEEDDLAAVYADLPESLTKANSGYKFAAGSRSEAWEVKVGNGSHKWYYAAGMTPDECMLIKQYDSSAVVSSRTPHCAISTPFDCGPVRQSIEVRCLCFWEDQ
ncbi:hypothetical protein RQP46_003283 [Phenoliferia psychrophenolica]